MLTFPRRGLLVLVAIAALLVGAAPAHAATPPNPTQDPFYAYSGSLTGVTNGTVLRTRQITFEAMGLSVPVSAHQLLFKTTDELGAPVVAVTTVVSPAASPTANIVSYQWAYDGLAANCEPSYAIRGGTPTEGTNSDEQLLSTTPLAAGDTVVITDYESEGNDFAAGRMEGQITLDGVRAAENFLNDPASTKVALVGYSGGAIASDWAAELASAYAPNLDIVGTAMGGIAVDLAHNLTYVNGSQEWSGAIPAALIGIARAFGVNPAQYDSAYGAKLLAEVGSTCLESDLGSYPGLTYQQLLSPKYTNVDQVPPLVHALNTLIMGTGGVPREPLYMGVGDADGTGDDVMVDADDEALAHKYCDEGLRVEFNLYKGENHGDAGLSFLPQGLDWAISMLAGAPAMQGCASIPAGDALTPLTLHPVPGTSATATLILRYRSLSAGRTAHLVLRAEGGSLNVRVRLLNAAGRTLATRTVKLSARRLATVSLTARRRLTAGHYRIVATSGSRRLASRTFTVR